MKIYGLAGCLGAGKDYVAKEYIMPILHAHGIQFVTTLGIADALKAHAISKYGLKHEDVFAGNKDAAVRRYLQLCGGDKDWVHEARIALKTLAVRGAEAVIITDIRSQKEVDLVVDEFGGTVFRIESPGRTNKRLDIECAKDPKLREKICSHKSEMMVSTLKVTDVWKNDDDQIKSVDFKLALGLQNNLTRCNPL